MNLIHILEYNQDDKGFSLRKIEGIKMCTIQDAQGQSPELDKITKFNQDVKSLSLREMEWNDGIEGDECYSLLTHDNDNKLFL